MLFALELSALGTGACGDGAQRDALMEFVGERGRAEGATRAMNKLSEARFQFGQGQRVHFPGAGSFYDWLAALLAVAPAQVTAVGQSEARAKRSGAGADLLSEGLAHGDQRFKVCGFF